MASLCLSQLCQQNKIIQQVNHEIAVCVDEGSRDACWTSRSPAYFSFSSPSRCACSPAHVSRTLPAFSPERHSSLGCSSESPLGTPGELQPQWLAQESALAASLCERRWGLFPEEVHPFQCPLPCLERAHRGLLLQFCSTLAKDWHGGSAQRRSSHVDKVRSPSQQSTFQQLIKMWLKNTFSVPGMYLMAKEGS